MYSAKYLNNTQACIRRCQFLLNSVRHASKYEPQKYDVPQLNKGRLDWLFGDGYRRPLAIDQGQKMRKDWICFGHHPTDEYADWKSMHKSMIILFFIVPASIFVYFFYKIDSYRWDDWAAREAHFEIERRRKAGLPLISKDLIDPKKIIPTLPSEEELGTFNIII